MYGVLNTNQLSNQDIWLIIIDFGIFMTYLFCYRYRVTAKGISAEGEIMIRIYPPAYWDLLQIRRNKTLYVEESTSVIISRDILEVRMKEFS